MVIPLHPRRVLHICLPTGADSICGLLKLNDQTDPASPARSPALGIAGQVVANTSLLIAVLVYMGWAYETAFYGYFHVNPLNLGIGIIEYMLVSLSLFSPVLVIAVASLILVSAARLWRLDPTRLARFVGGRAANRILVADSHGRLVSAGPAKKPQVDWRPLMGFGAIVTVTAIALALTAGYIHVSTYLVLGLLAVGTLLLTWPTRADRHGRFPYAVAIVLAAVCALWAGSLYATQLGKNAAEHVASDLSARTAVALYAVESLALSGPGVYVKALPAGSFYHYRYQGLRLLTMRSGTYYLLPVGWSSHLDSTYVIDDSDQVRIELY